MDYFSRRLKRGVSWSVGNNHTAAAFLIREFGSRAYSMSGRFNEAKAVARAFLNRMGPKDIANVIFFNDRNVVKHMKWADKKTKALAFVDSVPGTYPFAVHRRSQACPVRDIIEGPLDVGLGTGMLAASCYASPLISGNA